MDPTVHRADIPHNPPLIPKEFQKWVCI